MNDRKLASIQTIIALQPIPGADNIEVASVLGWHVVVRKGEFSIGDQCVYFEVDSFLPLRPEFEFLAKSGTKKMKVDGEEKEGVRLRTIRLRGQVSQGLCLPLSILQAEKIIFEEGTDVTDWIGVIKYEPPIPAVLAGTARGVFPSFIPKTDEPRIQANPGVIERYQGTVFYVTEKLDGSSMTAFIRDGELHVCSRGLDLKEDATNTFWKVARAIKLNEKLSQFGERYAVQGELIGENIQKNRLGIKGHTCRFFNIYNIEEGKYVNFANFVNLCEAMELSTVPLIETKYKLPKTVDELVSFSTKKSTILPSAWAEGFVFRPVVEMHDEDLGRLSFKCINPEFLLTYGE